MYNQYETDYNNNANVITRTLPTTKKSVKFDPYLMAHESNRTQEDISSSWYTKEEVATFKKERKDFIRVLKKMKWNIEAVDTRQYCTRGFEVYFSRRLNKEVNSRRSLAIKSVLMEQLRQRMLHIYDDESIRIVAASVSQWAQDKALDLGTKYSDESLMDSLLEMPLAGECSENVGLDFMTPDSFPPVQPFPCFR